MLIKSIVQLNKNFVSTLESYNLQDIPEDDEMVIYE